MLEIGNKVPSFCAKNQDSTEISDSLLLGKKYILFFYGQDDTPTCTKQVCSASDVFDEAKKYGFEIYGISKDTVSKHQKFIQKYDLKINLLSDPDNKMMLDFEAFGPKIFMGKEVNGVYRKAYFIDDKGMIIGKIDDVKASEQGNMILEVLKKL